MGFFDDVVDPFAVVGGPGASGIPGLSGLPGMSGSGGVNIPGLGGMPGSPGATGVSTPPPTGPGLTTGVASAGGGIFGGKPGVPTAPDLGASQLTANAANQAALPGLIKTATGVDEFNQSQLESVLNNVIPGWKGIMGQAGGVISSEIAGQLPQGVQDQIRTQDAERATAGGFGGSGASANLTARDLGLSSLQLTQQGLAANDAWIQTAKQNLVAPQMNIQSGFISPEQQYSANQNAWSTQYLANQVAAAPDPTQRGAFDTTMTMLGMVLSVYSGGSRYQPSNNDQANSYAGPGAGNGATSGGYGGSANNSPDVTSQDFYGGNSTDTSNIQNSDGSGGGGSSLAALAFI